MHQHKAIDIQVNKQPHCACCGKKHFHVHVHRKVAITPDGALDPLPVIGTTAVSASTLDNAIAVFDEFFDEYEDMLVASVVNMSVTDVLGYCREWRLAMESEHTSLSEYRHKPSHHREHTHRTPRHDD